MHSSNRFLHKCLPAYQYVNNYILMGKNNPKVDRKKTNPPCQNRVKLSHEWEMLKITRQKGSEQTSNNDVKSLTFQQD